MVKVVSSARGAPPPGPKPLGPKPPRRPNPPERDPPCPSPASPPGPPGAGAPGAGVPGAGAAGGAGWPALPASAGGVGAFCAWERVQLAAAKREAIRRDEERDMRVEGRERWVRGWEWARANEAADYLRLASSCSATVLKVFSMKERRSSGFMFMMRSRLSSKVFRSLFLASSERAW